MGDIIKSCIITHTDAKVVKTYDISGYGESYHTSIDLAAHEVYSPCRGVAIYVGLVDKMPSVTVQYSNNISLRFMHLKSTDIVAGQIVPYDAVVGIADEYVSFEYLTTEERHPGIRVFFYTTLGSYTLYKQDPMLVLSQNVKFDNMTPIILTEGITDALAEDGKGGDE
jgi:hypothetical protein